MWYSRDYELVPHNFSDEQWRPFYSLGTWWYWLRHWCSCCLRVPLCAWYIGCHPSPSGCSPLAECGLDRGIDARLRWRIYLSRGSSRLCGCGKALGACLSLDCGFAGRIRLASFCNLICYSFVALFFCHDFRHLLFFWAQSTCLRKWACCDIFSWSWCPVDPGSSWLQVFKGRMAPWETSLTQYFLLLQMATV